MSVRVFEVIEEEGARISEAAKFRILMWEPRKTKKESERNYVDSEINYLNYPTS